MKRWCVFQFTRPFIPEDGVFINTDVNMVEFDLSRLIETVSHPDVHTIRIVGFLFENRLQWQFEAEIISTNSDFMIRTYLLINKTQI